MAGTDDPAAIFKSYGAEYAATQGLGLSDPNALNVYMGPMPTQTSHRDDQGPMYWSSKQSPRVMTQDLAEQNFFTWTPTEQQQFQNKLYRAGLLSDPSDIQGAVREWQSAVAFAGAQYTYGKKTLTPWDYIQDRLGLAKAAGLGNGPKTRTSTSTTAQVLTNGDANAMIKTIYQNELGRDPTAAEMSRYRSMLINKVKDNPQVSSTTTTTDAQGNSTSNTTNSGGVNQSTLEGLVKDPTQADPEWGAYQAATTYMGALEGLLGGSPDLTNG